VKAPTKRTTVNIISIASGTSATCMDRRLYCGALRRGCGKSIFNLSDCLWSDRL